MAEQEKPKLFGDTRTRNIKAPTLDIRGHLLKFRNVAIQISNVSLVTSENEQLPTFPYWAAGVAFIGLILLSVDVLLGLAVFCVGIVFIARWAYLYYEANKHNYLHILLNSGYTYSLVFADKNFLDFVMNKIEGIFALGINNKTDVTFNIEKCEFHDNSSMIDNDYNWGNS